MEETTKKIIMMGFLLMTVIGLSFSFIVSLPANPIVKYNNIKFVQEPSGNFWTAKINGKEAAFTYTPADVQPITVEENPFQLLKDKIEVDATYNLNDTYSEGIALAYHQMSLVLQQYGVYVRSGAANENSYNLPVITCNSSTEMIPVLYFTESNATKIKREQNCILVEISSQTDAIKAKDRVLYGFFGVMSD